MVLTVKLYSSYTLREQNNEMCLRNVFSRLWSSVLAVPSEFVNIENRQPDNTV